MDQAIVDLPENARCTRCGYSLHRLKVDRCPECGTAFDRGRICAALSGERLRLPFDARAARMLAAPPWWATGVACLAILSLFFQTISIAPPARKTGSWYGVFILATALAVYLLRMWDRFIALERYELTEAQRRKPWGLNSIVLPILCATCILLRYCDVGGSSGWMVVAFNLSRLPMHSLAQRVITTHVSAPDQHVGLYDLTEITPMSDGVDFRIKGPTDAGFAYTTTGSPPVFRPDAIPLGGGWYAFNGS
jgi:hypothetical protein